MKRLSLILAVVLAAVFSATPAAVAAPEPLTGTIALDQESPSLGDVVTFTTTTSAREQCHSPKYARCYRVDVECSQGGQVVYYADANAEQQFLLGLGGSWASGPADCVATLFTYTDFDPVTRFDIASTAFVAGG